MTQYAPYPNAMATDIWPDAVSDMTEQLMSAPNPRRSSKPPSPSLAGSSPYDIGAHAAAGPTPLVTAQQRSYPPVEPAGRFRGGRTSMTPAALETNGFTQPFNGGPLRLPPSPMSPEPPSVVLTPPDGEHTS